MKEKMEKMKEGKEGIERVKQRKGDMEMGKGGKMSQCPKEKANWNRSGSSTPKKG